MSGALNMLPSFNDKNRELYARWRSGVDGVKDLQALAAGNPQDVATLGRYRDRMAAGLRRKQAADGVETAGICLAQVGACGFLPLLLTQNAALICGAAGAALGGMALLVGGIFLGKGYPQKVLFASPQDLSVFVRYQQLQAGQAKQDAASRQRAADRTREFAGTLDKMAAPAPAPSLVAGPRFVEINGVRIPVRPASGDRR